MTVKILDPDLSCNYSICGTDTHLCTVAFIASPSVLVHVQEKRVQKLLLACIDIEDRCRNERVSGNSMRAQVPQTQCCHRIRHRLYPPRGWCAAIGVTSPVTRPNWPISFHHAELWKRVLCQALSSVTALEWRRCFEKAMKTGAIEMPLIMICSVHLMWMPQFDNSFSYGNFNNTERHFFLLFCHNAGLLLSAVLFCTLVWDGVVALYDSSDDVYELRADNFQKMVLDSDFVWVVEFYAPWWATTALIHTAATTSWI